MKEMLAGGHVDVTRKLSICEDYQFETLDESLHWLRAVKCYHVIVRLGREFCCAEDNRYSYPVYKSNVLSCVLGIPCNTEKPLQSSTVKPIASIRPMIPYPIDPWSRLSPTLPPASTLPTSSACSFAASIPTRAPGCFADAPCSAV